MRSYNHSRGLPLEVLWHFIQYVDVNTDSTDSTTEILKRRFEIARERVSSHTIKENFDILTLSGHIRTQHDWNITFKYNNVSAMNPNA